jgi:hypothetical protein
MFKTENKERKHGRTTEAWVSESVQPRCILAPPLHTVVTCRPHRARGRSACEVPGPLKSRKEGRGREEGRGKGQIRHNHKN